MCASIHGCKTHLEKSKSNFWESVLFFHAVMAGVSFVFTRLAGASFYTILLSLSPIFLMYLTFNVGAHV